MYNLFFEKFTLFFICQVKLLLEQVEQLKCFGSHLRVIEGNLSEVMVGKTKNWVFG